MTFFCLFCISAKGIFIGIKIRIKISPRLAEIVNNIRVLKVNTNVRGMKISAENSNPTIEKAYKVGDNPPHLLLTMHSL